MLTIDPSVSQSDTVGAYNCTVENARGRSSMTVIVGELILKEYVYVLLLPSLYSHLTITLQGVDFPGHLMKPDIGRNLFYMLGDLPKLALQSNVVH